MFVNRSPNFIKGRILKTEMLETLRDAPRELADLRCRDFSDGVMTGAAIRAEPGRIVIGPGLLKHRGRLFHLAAEYGLPFRSEGRLTIVKVRFGAERSDGDFTEQTGEIVLDERAGAEPNEIELGRFKLKEGARLRTEYGSFADFATEFNTLNLLHVPWSGLGVSTLHPRIVLFFAEELLKSPSADVHDAAFAMTCLNAGRAERAVLLHYLSRRLERAFQDYENAVLHRELDRIAQSLQGSRKGAAGARGSGPYRMVVD